MLTGDALRAWYGWAEVSPSTPIEAGSLGRWQVTYHVGRYGLAAGGSLKLLFPSASDWPALQGRDPYEVSFLTASTSGRAQLAWRYDARGHAHPWPKAVIVDVAQAGLAEGDAILLYLGDPEGGSPGVWAQTVVQSGYEFRIVVDAHGTGHYLPVPSPRVDIVPGPAAALVLVTPSQAVAGEPFELLARLEDRWGNLARGYSGTVHLQGVPGLEPATLSPADGGRKRVRAMGPSRTGTYWLQAREERLGLAAESNPLRVEPAAAGGYRPLWGDLHGHSAEGGGGSPAGYLRYARDVAGLDFCSYQADDPAIDRQLWQELQQSVRAHNEPGRFAAFLGYRWAGNTAGGGARNVLFSGDNAPLFRCRHPAEPGDEEAEICFPLSRLHSALHQHQALLIAGIGSPPASLEHADPHQEGLLEVHSAWGQAGGLLEEALQHGLLVGLVAGSAAGIGRPGGHPPGAGDLVCRGGLTCALALGCTRNAIWEALRARRCYATSGARIMLQVQSAGHTMGEVYQATRPPRISVRVTGTAEIERVEIRRGAELAYRYPEMDTPRRGWVRVLWGGALGRDWPRSAPWDGTLQVHGARIVAAQPYGFDTPARGIVLSNEQSVSWRSITAGNTNGVLLQLEDGPGAQIEFHAPHVALSVPLAELPREERLGGEGLYVRVEHCPHGAGCRDLQFAWTGDALPHGTTPYFVTVYQVDGARAWSSPIYLIRV